MRNRESRKMEPMGAGGIAMNAAREEYLANQKVNKGETERLIAVMRPFPSSRLLVLGLLSALLNSCDIRNHQNKILSYRIHEEFRIKVGHSNYDRELSCVYTDNGNSLYYSLRENVITIYDLHGQAFINELHFPKEGNSGIGAVTDFHVVSPDSIFLLSADQQMVTLTNSDAEIYKKWQLDLPSEIAGIITYNGFRVGYNQGVLTFRTYPAIDPQEPAFYNHAFIAFYDLNSKTMLKRGSYPDEYKNPGLWNPTSLYTGFLTVGNRHFVNHPIDHNLYDLTDNAENIHPAQSDYLPQSFELFTRNSDLQTERNDLIENGYYYDLLYDPFTDVYLRIVKHPQELYNSNGLLNQVFDASFSIIVLTSGLQVLGEALIHGSLYNFNDIKVTENGLLLSKDISENPDDLEEYLEFDVIQIELQ